MVYVSVGSGLVSDAGQVMGLPERFGLSGLVRLTQWRIGRKS